MKSSKLNEYRQAAMKDTKIYFGTVERYWCLSVGGCRLKIPATRDTAVTHTHTHRRHRVVIVVVIMFSLSVGVGGFLNCLVLWFSSGPLPCNMQSHWWMSVSRRRYSN